MQLANQHFTLVLGLDVHFNTLPPFNPLHPFIGLVIDPMDYVPFVGGTVYINGRQRGVSDTSGMLLTWKHIPLFSGPFALMPLIGHESVNFFGSVNTYADGSRLSPAGHMVMSCNDVGIPLSLQPSKKFQPLPSLFAPTSISIPIPSGPPVFVGGPYVPDLEGALKNMVMSYGFGALLKAGGKLLAKAAKLLNKKVLQKFGATKGLGEKFCKWGFEPVDLINGRVMYNGVDFELPGPIPLRWERVYYSDSTMSGLLGVGTHLCYDQKLEVFDDCIGLTLPDGRAIGFDLLAPGESYFHRPEQLTLSYGEDRDYTLFDHASRLHYHFLALSEGHYRLSHIENGRGHRIRFTYQRQQLCQVIDSGGRVLQVHTDSTGRITGVDFQAKGKEPHSLIRYAYNEEGDLAAITDALGQTTRMSYQQHRMVEKTDRNGQTFYWRYDGHGRCVHTWGEGGLLEGRIRYEKDHNLVTDGLGRTSRYDFNAEGQCTQLTHPEGGHTLYEYDAWGELYREIDPDGRLTGYHYDEQGRQTGVTLPDGTTRRHHYNGAGQLMMRTDGEGHTQVWTHNQAGLLTSSQAPDGGVTLYGYNEQQLLAEVRDPSGQAVRLAYDEAHNLREVTLPDGSKNTWYYDSLGRCMHATRSGALQTFTYDALGRITRVQLPDGNHIRLTYNAYDEVIEAAGHRQQVRFAYTPMGQLKMRWQDGKQIHFHYNQQEELLALSNEKGERYHFERNRDGDVVAETGFDGLTRRYQRSKGGVVRRIERPGGRWTEYEHDGAGRIVRAEYSDGSWETYHYDKNGALRTARNPQSVVHLERDALGRVVKEKQEGYGQTDYLVESRYDALSNRSGLSSSLGALLQLAYNPLGQVSQYLAGQGMEAGGWEAQLSYNSQGLEVERLMNHHLRSAWRYDSAGHPLEHRVGEGKRVTRHKRYHWGTNDRLTGIGCELSGLQQSFEYSEEGQLTGRFFEQNFTFSAEHYFRDPVGNLFESKDRKDRTYGAGGQLQERKGTRYEYDAEGFLLTKTDQDGNSWHYRWQGNGMLQSVVRPDRQTVSFEYDALGRRTAKIFQDRITRWVWDGNNPLHEWTYHTKDRPQAVIGELGKLTRDREEPVEGMITWVFEEGTFKPAAKLTGGKAYSILTDYLGTPQEAYEWWGNKVWAIELEAYGKVKSCEGWLGVPADESFIPFRFQGQYHDMETGLYYNRFRYYSPEEGMYVTAQDPIGLMGGDKLYAYVDNPNAWVDVFGLAVVVGQVADYKTLVSLSDIGDDLDLHHIPQDKLGHLPKPDGAAVVMPHSEHRQTRTYKGRGSATAAIDKNRAFKDVLKDDLVDLRKIGGKKYDKSIREIISFYEGNKLLGKGELKLADIKKACK
jgi:RHS repeat-associated protein